MNMELVAILVLVAVLLFVGGLIGAGLMYSWLLRRSEDPSHPEEWYL